MLKERNKKPCITCKHYRIVKNTCTAYVGLFNFNSGYSINVMPTVTCPLHEVVDLGMHYMTSSNSPTHKLTFDNKQQITFRKIPQEKNND